jgi:uncharacterized protein (DUF1697 family)
MNIYIVLLRGVNVSGKNILKMSELTDRLIKAGFIDVKTYIQSGNIVFSYEVTPYQELEKKLKDLVLENFNLDIPVDVLSYEEIRKAIEFNPFIRDTAIDIQHLHVTFLSGVPDEEKIIGIKNGNYGSDQFFYSEKLIYLHCPKGYGKTKLTNTMLESKLKVNATTRNWKTINELLKMAENLKKT